jgi:SAM-dependent methyltransferase
MVNPSTNPSAFDALATSYDAAFSYTQIGRWLRGRVHARLNTHFQAGDHVLELGCGTGEDAMHLALQGIYVVATDASETMLDITRHKAHDTTLVQVEFLDLAHLPEEAPHPTDVNPDWSGFSGVFSNFGPVNVIGNWRPLAYWLSNQLATDGVVALGVMGRFCLWEMIWHALHLNFRTAFRRLRGRASFQPDHLTPMTIYYPTIQRLTHDFSTWFDLIHVESVGLFIPPSDVYGVIEKRPCLLNMLMNLEKRYSTNRFFANFADHYWIEFRKK